MKKETRNLISFLLAFFVCIVISIIDEFPKGSSWLGFFVGFGMFFFICRFFLNQFLKTETWVEVEKEIQEKKEDARIQSEHYKQLHVYQEARNTFKYFSDSRLIEVYNLSLLQKDEGAERLALEEIMVEKGLISHSPMHEKIHALKKYLNQ